MRATWPLYALTLTLFLLIAACGADGLVDPPAEGPTLQDARPLARAGDPCNPNLFPC